MNSIVKKILIILFGIFLGFVLLEIGLQTTVFILKTTKEYNNKKIQKDSIINILCIGESTTDNQWPPILQKILDAKSKHKKFKVIDEGHTGTHTFFILKNIKNYMVKYQPDYVILMIGTNDNGLYYKQDMLKILYLLRLILMHIKTKYFYDYTCETLQIELDIVTNLINNKKFKEAEKILKMLMVKSNNSSELIANSFTFLYANTLQFNEMKKMFDDYKGSLNYNLLYSMENCLQNLGYSKEEFRNWLIENKKRLHKKDNDIISIINKYNCPFLLEEISCNNINDDFLVKHQILNADQILQIKKNNYIEIIDTIYDFNKNTKIVLMQYPMLSVEELRETVKNSKHYDKLIFLSNEINFKNSLRIHKKEQLFRDMFAGVFGHCTELGNTLIAENVSEFILGYKK